MVMTGLVGCGKVGANLCAKSFDSLWGSRKLSHLGHAETGRNARVGACYCVGLEPNGAYAVVFHSPVGVGSIFIFGSKYLTVVLVLPRAVGAGGTAVF